MAFLLLHKYILPAKSDYKPLILCIAAKADLLIETIYTNIKTGALRKMKSAPKHKQDEFKCN